MLCFVECVDGTWDVVQNEDIVSSHSTLSDAIRHWGASDFVGGIQLIVNGTLQGTLQFDK